MPGPAPKDPRLRQRRNKTATAANLPSEKVSARNRVPDLPPLAVEWHAMAVESWRLAWTSPMVSEWVEADKPGLWRWIILVQDYWAAKDGDERTKLDAAIRRAEALYGLAPMPRRTLQWNVEQGEQAVEKTTRRKRSKQVEKATAGKDPRDLLKLA